MDEKHDKGIKTRIKIMVQKESLEPSKDDCNRKMSENVPLFADKPFIFLSFHLGCDLLFFHFCSGACEKEEEEVEAEN